MGIPTPQSTAPPQAHPARPARILAVGGGKGGIGKTLVSTSLAIELAHREKQVVIVDADLGGANVHTCLGIDPPLATLSDFVNRRVANIADISVPSGMPGLRVISGAMDSLDAANLGYQQKQKLLRHLQRLDVDYVILDLGAGTHFNVLDMFLIADRGVVVLTPEPTSIENCYRFVKSAFFRHLSYMAESESVRSLLDTALATKGVPRTPFHLLQEIQKQAPQAAERMRAAVAAFRPALVVNGARTLEDRETGYAVVAAWKKYFGLEMDFLGALHHDDEVWQSVRRRRPVLADRPQSVIAKDFQGVVNQLLVLDYTRPLKAG